MAAILPTGMRAISTEISPETGAGGFILPNDRVDVILSKREKNADHATGDSVNSETILGNVRVLAVDQTIEEKNGQKVVVGKTATLELKPEQAETLARSRQMGTLSLALRSLADANAPENRHRRSEARQRQCRPLRRSDPDHRTEVIKDGVMKCTTNPTPLQAFVARSLSFAAIAAFTLNPALTPVFASDYRVPAAMAGARMNARSLSLGIGKSVVVDLPRDVKDVLVADPKIANAVVRSAQRAYIIGAAVGQTNIVFFDSAGQQISAYDIAVTRDLNGLRAALKQLLPNADIKIDGLGDGVMLTGWASSPDRSAAGGRSGCAPRRRRGQSCQQHRGARPRPGHAQGHGRRSGAHHHQAAGRRPQRQPELRHRGREFQQRESVHRARPAANEQQS